MAFLRHDRKIGGLKRARVACCLSLCIILADGAGMNMQGQSIEEYQLKAAFLFNFTKFISWPHADVPSKFTACIVSAKDVAEALEAVTRGKSVDGRQVVVQELRSPAPLETCQLLFIGSGQEKKVEEILAGARKLPIVTVSEDDKFLRRGGMINFVLEDGKLRFEVNIAAASRSGIGISSKLLQLAIKVYEKP
jgi:hypothetical protein